MTGVQTCALPICRFLHSTFNNKFVYIARYIFRNAESEIGWSVRERALRVSKLLSDHLEKEMDALTGHTSDAVRSKLLNNASLHLCFMIALSAFCAEFHRLLWISGEANLGGILIPWEETSPNFSSNLLRSYAEGS